MEVGYVAALVRQIILTMVYVLPNDEEILQTEILQGTACSTRIYMISMISVEIPVHFSDDLQSCSGLHGMDTFIFVVMDGCESEKSWLERLRSLVRSGARSSELSVSAMIINLKAL